MDFAFEYDQGIAGFRTCDRDFVAQVATTRRARIAAFRAYMSERFRRFSLRSSMVSWFLGSVGFPIAFDSAADFSNAR